MNSPTAVSESASPLPRAAVNQARALVAAVGLFAVAVVFWPHTSRTRSQGGFLLDADGRAATLGTRLAPVTLLHFWATWCPPCIAEAPSLGRLERDYAGRHDFAIVTVAVADSRARVSAFLGPSAASALYDPQWEVAHRYGTEKLPETYLLVDGKVVERFVGMTDWDAPDVRARLDRLLKNPAEGERTETLTPPRQASRRGDRS
jgi:thiol-disulfide isomerase/thioredoxin